MTANEWPAPVPVRVPELRGNNTGVGSNTFSVFPLPQFPCSFHPQDKTIPLSINYILRRK